MRTVTSHLFYLHVNLIPVEKSYKKTVHGQPRWHINYTNNIFLEATCARRESDACHRERLEKSVVAIPDILRILLAWESVKCCQNQNDCTRR